MVLIFLGDTELPPRYVCSVGAWLINSVRHEMACRVFFIVPGKTELVACLIETIDGWVVVPQPQQADHHFVGVVFRQAVRKHLS